jgi:energy-coupling factor transporter ATP-binding protein EcfA2
MSQFHDQTNNPNDLNDQCNIDGRENADGASTINKSIRAEGRPHAGQAALPPSPLPALSIQSTLSLESEMVQSTMVQGELELGSLASLPGPEPPQSQEQNVIVYEEILDEQTERGFPPALLASPMAVRGKYFQAKIIAHPRLMAVLRQIMLSLRYPIGDASLIWVFGPSGVGKTTLARKLLRLLIEEHRQAMEEDPGIIAATLVELALTATGKFDWSDVYGRVLISLNEMLINYKVDMEENSDSDPRLITSGTVEDNTRNISAGTSGKMNMALSVSNMGIQHSMLHREVRLIGQKRVELKSLRQAVESCLRHRKVQAVLLDEAHHLKKVAISGRALLDQLDVLKSLSNVTGVPLVFFGTYELLGLVEISDQICRRSTSIHFPRYKYEEPSDMQNFLSAAYTFQVSLPLRSEPNLTADCDYLYIGSLGCVGLLKTWLYRALMDALEDGEKRPFRKYLERHKMSASELETIMRRITEGEAAFRGRDDTRYDLSVSLGIDTSRTSRQERAGGGTSDRSSATQTPTPSTPGKADPTKPPKQQRRVGERLPHRDPVGPPPQ